MQVFLAWQMRLFWHSSDLRQAPPAADCFVHFPLAQAFPTVHSSSEAQVSPTAFPEQVEEHLPPPDTALQSPSTLQGSPGSLLREVGVGLVPGSLQVAVVVSVRE